ncbi:MAG: folate-binding protein [Proteobacteria bacterium]|nr:folate-binding protein [Pseudomonadota bacterium]MDA1131759.1 folate-binding protein [Pseudomonadota bacterium]
MDGGNHAIRTLSLPDRGLVGLGGGDARTFLQNLVSNDVRRVGSSQAIYSLLLTPQGKFLHDFFIAEVAAEGAAPGLVLDCERDRVDDLIRRLTFYRLRADVAINDLSDRFAVHVAFGPDDAATLNLEPAPGAARTEANGAVFVDPRLSDLGVRAILPVGRSLDLPLARHGDRDDYELLRLNLGVPDGSRDLEIERTFPLEASLDQLHAIDYRKGCYIGQELTARTHYRATLRNRLFPVAVDGPLPPAGAQVLLDERIAGEVRSGSGDRALAMLRLALVDESTRSGARLTAGNAMLVPIRPEWMATADPAATSQ